MHAMIRFHTAARLVSALLGFLAAAIGALYAWDLYTNPVDRGWATYAAVAVLAVGASLFLRIAVVGNPGHFLSRRMTLTPIASRVPVGSDESLHR